VSQRQSRSGGDAPNQPDIAIARRLASGIAREQGKWSEGAIMTRLETIADRQRRLRARDLVFGASVVLTALVALALVYAAL
jgi:hypothetical protein